METFPREWNQMALELERDSVELHVDVKSCHG